MEPSFFILNAANFTVYSLLPTVYFSTLIICGSP